MRLGTTSHAGGTEGTEGASWPLVRDADAEPPEAPALALDLDDLDPAHLAGGGDVGAAVRLLVQAHDVDDPNVLDLRRHEIGRGADDVGQRERLVPWQYPYVDAPVRQ